jgi:hypothetical protein
LATLQLGNLRLGDPGHEAQMVVSTTLLFTFFPPTAHITMLDWLRIELSARLVGHSATQASSHVAVVGAIISGPEWFWFVVRPRRHHISAFGCKALHLSDQF